MNTVKDDNKFQLFQLKGSLGFDHRLYCKGMTGVDQEKQERFVRSNVESGEGDSSGNSSIGGENDVEEEGGNGNPSDNDMWKVLMEEGGDILEELTPCDTRVLVHSEEELSQCETFERIFPTPDTGHYLQYIDTNYYDLLLVAWEKRYAMDRQTGQGQTGNTDSRDRGKRDRFSRHFKTLLVFLVSPGRILNCFRRRFELAIELIWRRRFEPFRQASAI